MILKLIMYDMSYMFYDCYSLNNLDVIHFDTKNVTDNELYVL